MNKKALITLLAIFSFIFLSFHSVRAQSGAVQTAVKLFKYVTVKNYRKASKLIAYKGSNLKRNLKTSYNYNVKSERKKVERICKRIFKYFRISDSFKILKRKTKNLKNGGREIFVQFKSGKQKLEIGFKFVKVKDKYLLADID